MPLSLEEVACLWRELPSCLWGQTAEPDREHWLRGGAAPVREMDGSLAATPLPRPSRYRPGVHARVLLIAAGLRGAVERELTRPA